MHGERREVYTLKMISHKNEKNNVRATMCGVNVYTFKWLFQHTLARMTLLQDVCREIDTLIKVLK